jgi:hypothetical protein
MSGRDPVFGSSAPSDSAVAPAPPRPITRLQKGIRKPKVYTDGIVCYGLLATSGEPHDHREALTDPMWKKAMDSEFDALLMNDTWHLVSPKKGVNVINCKWVSNIPI